jgi:hypothetical protein
MFSIHLIRTTRALTLGAVIAALVVPATALGSSSGASAALDVFERYAAVHPYGSGIGDQGPAPDWFERSAAAQTMVTIDGRSADTLDAVGNARQASLAPIDGRSPDTLEAASAPRPVVVAQPGGFDWADAGIGAGFTGGLLVLLAGVGTAWVRHQTRQRIQTT